MGLMRIYYIKIIILCSLEVFSRCYFLLWIFLFHIVLYIITCTFTKQFNLMKLRFSQLVVNSIVCNSMSFPVDITGKNKHM